MPRIEPKISAYYLPPLTNQPLTDLPPPPGAPLPYERAARPMHRRRARVDAVSRADRHFRRMHAALNASEGNWVDRIFAGWRVRWQVHRLHTRLRQLGVHGKNLPPLRKAFVRKKVPIDITDVAWHEQLRLWWWPPALSPDIGA